MDNKLASGFNSLFTAAKNAVQGVDQSVPEEVKQQRLDTCLNCPKLIELTKQCGECLCFVNYKTSLRQEKCPLEKWTEYKVSE